MMAKYHVGCGIAGIYAGTLKKSGDEWLNKSDVTNEAMGAVAQYMLDNHKGLHFLRDGKEYCLRVIEVSKEGKDE